LHCEIVAVIPVVVISLRRSAERREAMSAHLGSLGIPFSYFDGIDGSKMTDADIAALRPPQRLGRYPLALTPGEIGCAASFQALLRRIASGPDEHVCVAEDDALFSTAAPDFLDTEFLCGLPEFDVLRMVNDGLDAAWPRRFIARHGDRRIYAPLKLAYLLTGQVFSRAGAARIAAGMVPLVAPIDNLIYHDVGIFGLRILEVRPAVVTPRSGASIIGDDRFVFRDQHRPRTFGYTCYKWLSKQTGTPRRWLRSSHQMASYAQAWGIRALTEALRTGSNYERISDTLLKFRGPDQSAP
jgi:glycosyl transferase family 25